MGDLSPQTAVLADLGATTVASPAPTPTRSPATRDGYQAVHHGFSAVGRRTRGHTARRRRARVDIGRRRLGQRGSLCRTAPFFDEPLELRRRCDLKPRCRAPTRYGGGQSAFAAMIWRYSAEATSVPSVARFNWCTRRWPVRLRGPVARGIEAVED